MDTTTYYLWKRDEKGDLIKRNKNPKKILHRDDASYSFSAAELKTTQKDGSKIPFCHSLKDQKVFAGLQNGASILLRNRGQWTRTIVDIEEIRSEWHESKIEFGASYRKMLREKRLPLEDIRAKILQDKLYAWVGKSLLNRYV